jgi:formylglycine-generating enzyme required for sulfatase activity
MVGALVAMPRERVTPKTTPSAPEPRPSAPPSRAPSVVVDAGVPERPYSVPDAGTLEAQRGALFENLEYVHGLDESQMGKVRAIFAASDVLSQGNPKKSEHPLTRDECLARRAAAKQLAEPDASCGAPHMVPLYDPSAAQRPEQAQSCIDQFEFPNIPCEFPVVWARANEAAELCDAVGKRLCDAHEWEGACAGALKPVEQEYAFGERRMMMEHLHNEDREIVWAYGEKSDLAKCATGSTKSPKCFASEGFGSCGTNDYPAGSFPECVSSLGVYDQHGNVAEHMNLPLKPEELASRGGLGETEMKGSWFVFARGQVHPDDCRWRALAWHAGKIQDKNSHRNYHLGFRCCRNKAAAKP